MKEVKHGNPEEQVMGPCSCYCEMANYFEGEIAAFMQGGGCGCACPPGISESAYAFAAIVP